MLAEGLSQFYATRQILVVIKTANKLIVQHLGVC